MLMQLFHLHVSREVAERIWEQRDQFMEGGRLLPQRLIATVLFTDLRGYSSLAQQLSPEVLMDWLNEYMESMAQEVIEHGGVIDKFIGDAIMAVFGVPIPRTSDSAIDRDAVHAVDCALAMKDRLIALNARWQARALPTVTMRIGIFTGPLVVGSLGSRQRLEYTVIGEAANTAAALESFDKESAEADPGPPCRILIGEETLSRLNGQFDARPLTAAALKGKAEPVVIDRVLDRRKEKNGDTAQGGTR
jgi:adenylate cyclase